MNSEVKFVSSIGEVIDHIYNNPKPLFGKDGIRSGLVKCDQHIIEKLESLDIIEQVNPMSGNVYYIRLRTLGFEIIEKYGSWDIYNKKVLLRDEKAKDYEYIQKKYWYIPLVISVIALGFSMLSFFKN